MLEDKRMVERHNCEYTHDCPTLEERLPRFREAPSLDFGVFSFQVSGVLLLDGFEKVIENLDLIGLDDSVMEALRKAHETIESEIYCENVAHNEIFTQFLKDGMKFIPALQAAHRV